MEGEQLVEGHQERDEDSGIDSESERRTRNRGLHGILLSDSSSSEEDEVVEEMERNALADVVKSFIEKISQQKDLVEDPQGQDKLSATYIKSRTGSNEDYEDTSDEDRDSPPLLEVELTASDEDDDTSVLELVIPIQNKTQRVNSKFECWTFCKFFCCPLVMLKS